MTITFDAARKGPLQGIRVLDISRLLAGNMVSLQLADFGADVIKVEPLDGDPLRAWRNAGKSFYWKIFGRNKRSISLDLRNADAYAALLKMVDESDVFIENFRVGTLEKMGLGPDVLLARNAGLVIVRISGFGQTGPYADQPGFGTLVESMSGFASQNGFPEREPVLPPLGLGDKLAGVYGAMAVSMALLARERGVAGGQVIDLSLLEPIVALLGHEASILHETGVANTRAGSGSNTAVPRNVYRCADDGYISLSAPMQSVVAKVFDAIGKPEWNRDERFVTNSARVKHRVIVDGAIAEWFSTRTRDRALAEMIELGVTVAPVNDIHDIVADPHFRQRGVLVEVPDRELGSVLMNNIAPLMSQSPGVWRRQAPDIGEHTQEILAEFGYDAATIDSLRQARAIA